ncbi:hypothetical protein M6G53_12920 [Serratia nevei]|nr:hypothetical protein [Serratia nevei]
MSSYTSKPLQSKDPLGLDIVYANHEVALGAYHSKLIITPINQAAYANDLRFFNVNSLGQRYATIGAGPNSWAMLEYGDNRSKDVSEPNENSKKLAIPCAYKNEDEAIAELFRLSEKYNENKAFYTLIPVGGCGGFCGFNSNSFISGLGQAAGFNMPAPGETGATTPGYNNPLPAGWFGK